MSTTAILRIRRDTADDWTANDPTPEDGQLCFETDTKRFKLGDGSTAWTSLGYVLPYLTATDRLLGRSTSGAGSAEEITCTAAGRALLDDADAAAQRTTLGLGTDLLRMNQTWLASPNAGATLTDVAAADAFLFKSNRGVQQVDLTDFTQARLTCRVTTGATAGTKLIATYHTAFSTTVGDYVTLGTSEIEVSLSSTGTITSSWINLAAGAKADVFVAIKQSGGDGATDPVISFLELQFRRR